MEKEAHNSGTETKYPRALHSSDEEAHREGNDLGPGPEATRPSRPTALVGRLGGGPAGLLLESVTPTDFLHRLRKPSILTTPLEPPQNTIKEGEGHLPNHYPLHHSHFTLEEGFLPRLVLHL